MRTSTAVVVIIVVASLAGNVLAEDRADLSMAIAWHDGSNPQWFGDFPEDLYDGDEWTHGLVNYADEEVQVTFLFAGPIEIVGTRTFWAGAWGDPAYEWDFECADNVADLDGQSGSYKLLAFDVGTPADAWSEVSFAATSCRAMRWRGYRLTGDHYLHLNEIELFLAQPDSAMARKFVEPAGVAFDGEGRTVVADAGAGELVVVDDAGQLHARLGGGVLASPTDVEVDASGRFVVADTGNDRIVRLNADGSLDVEIATYGSGLGEVSQPAGVAIDATGRILVADTGNHRVQRFMEDGSLDETFGDGGAVGGPDPTWYDDGFDAPRGVFVEESTGEIVVADTNNERLQVLNASGVYLRSVDGVYHAHDVVQVADGTIVAVGDGTNYAHHQGSIRFVDPGGEFVDRQYFGGTVDVGRLTGGVAIRDDGALVVADRDRHILHRLRNHDAPALNTFQSTVGHDWIEISYETREATVTRVFYGEAGLREEVEDLTPKTEHRVRIEGLSPETIYEVAVAYPRTQDDQLVFGPTHRLRTEAGAELHTLFRLRTVGMIYTWGRSAQQMSDARERLNIVEEFYYRHSRGRLHLDVEVVEIDRKYGASDVEDWGGFKASSAESDLAAAGYGPEDDIDEVIVFFGGVPDLPGGNFGGSNTIFGRHVGYTSYVTEGPFVIVHEVNHTIDSIFGHLGYEPYEFNHGLWAVPSDAGFDLIVNGEIVQHVPDGRFAILSDPYKRDPTFSDPDGDGLLEDPSLPFTEAALGTDPHLPDTDFDGLSDFEEMYRGTTVGTDPLSIDTDGDGATQGADGVDKNPLINIEGYVSEGSPLIDGVMDPNEGWTLISSGVNLTNDFTSDSVDDPDHHPEAQVWAAWDETALYLAIRYASSNVTFKLDANGNGPFEGYDNHLLQFNTWSLWRETTAGADRDLMFAIDDDGGWSEIFDDSDKWLDPPPHGLGLEPLLTPGSVSFATGSASGGETIAEMKIPAGRRRQLEPHAGQVARLYVSLDGDVLWDHDTFARLLLVEHEDSDGDGLWDLQEEDLGSSPMSSDGDGDGLLDTEELGAGLDPLSSDTDADGALDADDCAPRDPGSKQVPGEVNDLRVEGEGVLSWAPTTDAGEDVLYDLLRERADGEPSGAKCLSGHGLADTSFTDDETPPPGTGWRYLVRARTRCGPGTWGQGASGSERERSGCP